MDEPDPPPKLLAPRPLESGKRPDPVFREDYLPLPGNPKGARYDENDGGPFSTAEAPGGWRWSRVLAVVALAVVAAFLYGLLGP